MIETGTLLTYAAVVLGLFLIPGPAVLLTIARASAGGARVGLATGLGISAGDCVHSAMAIFGLSAVLMTSALAFSVVKYAGAVYLAVLGIRAVLETGGDLHLRKAHLVDAGRAFRQGFVTEVLNPKTALFFLAFLPQFIHPAQGHVIGQLAVLSLIFLGMGIVFISAVALAAGRLGSWLARNRGIGRWQGRAIGLIYLALGARLALEER